MLKRFIGAKDTKNIFASFGVWRRAFARVDASHQRDTTTPSPPTEFVPHNITIHQNPQNGSPEKRAYRGTQAEPGENTI
jgi:hypothetical protein